MKILAIDPGTEKKFKVYMHTCPNGKVYIGMTSLSASNRWRNGKGYKGCIFFNRAIEKYGWENIKHDILYENLSLSKAQELEIRLIKEKKSTDKNFGYNIENGGQKGATGIKRSKETLIKMSKANLGKTLSEETKIKISNALKGRLFTKEHSVRKSLAQLGDKNHNYGKKASNKTRAKMVSSQKKGKNNRLSVKVVQFSIDTGEKIKLWNSMGDVRRELGFKHCGISDCCRGNQKTAYGFIWKYHSETQKKC